MQRMIMNLTGAELNFIKTTREIMKTRDYELVNLSETMPMVSVSKEELNDYILLLELSEDHET